MAATLKQSGLTLDHTAANAHIGPWLQAVANARIHGTTHEIPNERLQLERQHLQPLPVTVAASPPIPAVQGMDCQDAQQQLQGLGFQVSVQQGWFHKNQAAGTSPSGQAPSGSPVILACGSNNPFG